MRLLQELLVLASVVTPLLTGGVVLLRGPREGRGTRLGCVAAALPALLLGMLPLHTSTVTVSAEWLLLGTTFRLDNPGRVLLFLTGAVWAVAAGAARRLLDGGDRRSHRFGLAWLAALSGNLTLVLAGDLITFYAGFAVMSLSAYLLVIHDGTDFARRAGRIYLVMAILGDVTLLAGMFLTAGAAGTLDLGPVPAAVAASEDAGLIIALLVAGLGVKVGVPLLHMWLPLAHPAAPVPASAVLSGVMIKAGLVGWIRLLPLGGEGMVAWPEMLAVAGLVGALGAAAVGLTQSDPKVLLAYSSVSQMGLITLIIASGLGGEVDGSTTMAAAAVFALHHGLAKGVLFLAVGVAKGGSGPRWARLVTIGAAVPAAALVGLPLTSGALAKEAVKQTVVLPGGLPVGLMVSVSSVATGLLLIRFLLLLREQARGEAGGEQVVPGRWMLAGLGAVAGSWWLLPAVRATGFAPPSIDGANLVEALWPAVAAVAIAGAVARARLRYRYDPIPAGDLVVVLEPLGAVVTGLVRRQTPRSHEGKPAARWRHAGVWLARVLGRGERLVGRWDTAMGLAAILIVLLGVVVLSGS
jgi:formate hydrogenlyase subunit 3/multisubunit Na+/H+ antiporter MnhD subunit